MKQKYKINHKQQINNIEHKQQINNNDKQFDYLHKQITLYKRDRKRNIIISVCLFLIIVMAICLILKLINIF